MQMVSRANVNSLRAAPAQTRTRSGRARSTSSGPRKTLPSLPPPWADIVATLDHAFQPVVNTHSGITFGQEALLRNYAAAGFPSIDSFFETCHANAILTEIEFALCDKAMVKFCRIPDHENVKLFLNMDNRTLAGGEAVATRIRDLAHLHGLAEDAIVIEISERHPLGTPAEMTQILHALRRHGFRLAIDDFGIGFSGLQMLYSIESDIIKIDGFFINGIAGDTKKRLFLSQILGVARLLGILVVAEGMETEEDYLTCKDLGCELLQGYLIQKPSADIAMLPLLHETIQEYSRKWKRRQESDAWIVREQIERVEPVHAGTVLLKLFERFRGNKNATFFPVIDAMGVPLGIVRERDLKDYTYAHYGRSLLENKSLDRQLHHFIIKCPVADINANIDKILENLTADKAFEGIIIVQDMRYIGFLSSNAVLRVLNEKKLAAARDQSPLTKLPGNGIIHEFVSEALNEPEIPYVLCYLDFDNFKPFNDKYGFRVGDRAILMFAEMLRKSLSYEGAFIGHIGGDDFFFAVRGAQDFDYVAAQVAKVTETFGEEAASLYDEEARDLGFIVSMDRTGEIRRFPLMTVSAALVNLPASRAVGSVDDLSSLIAMVKTEAKNSNHRLCAVSPVFAISSSAASRALPDAVRRSM
jgi:diguanylate cyclase (GGDEF)-like protein